MLNEINVTPRTINNVGIAISVEKKVIKKKVLKKNVLKEIFDAKANKKLRVKKNIKE